MTVKEHLAKMHEEAAAHHSELAKGHRKLAKCFSKAEGIEGSADIAKGHEGLAATHDQAEKDHLAMCKSMGDELGKADLVVTDRVSGIITNFPGVRAVPRAGQQQPNATANVPLEFRDLVKVEDDL